MQLSMTIEALRQDIAALTALGDEATRGAGERITAAVGPIVTVRLLELLGTAALEVSGQMSHGHAELRVAGDEVSLVVVAEPEGPGVPDDGEMSARITLRLPEQLKSRVEDAAAREGTSTNTWIIKALTRATSAIGSSMWGGRPGRRMTGFGHT